MCHMSGTRPVPRPVKTWDVVITIILLVALATFTLAASVYALFIGMVSDNCGRRRINFTLIGLGVQLAIILPWIVSIGAGAWAELRLVRRRLAYWVPLAAVPLIVVVWYIAAMVAEAGAN